MAENSLSFPPPGKASAGAVNEALNPGGKCLGGKRSFLSPLRLLTQPPLPRRQSAGPHGCLVGAPEAPPGLLHLLQNVPPAAYCAHQFVPLAQGMPRGRLPRLCMASADAFAVWTQRKAARGVGSIPEE